MSSKQSSVDRLGAVHFDNVDFRQKLFPGYKH